MSYSSLWVIDKDFHGEKVRKFANSWLMTPMSLDVLFDKYMPIPEGEYRNIFDGRELGKLNVIMNNSKIEEDRIMWELGNQQVFATKDKGFVAKCIKNFLSVNSDKSKAMHEGIHERFNEVADAILAINEEEYPYFVWKNSSCDDGVEWWFKQFDENGEIIPKSLADWNKRVTEFVEIEDMKIVGFKPNLDFFNKQVESR